MIRRAVRQSGGKYLLCHFNDASAKNEIGGC